MSHRAHHLSLTYMRVGVAIWLQNREDVEATAKWLWVTVREGGGDVEAGLGAVVLVLLSTEL